jgi:kinesin family member 11
VVDEQMKDLNMQMTALDDFVTRARSENAGHQAQHEASVTNLSDTVDTSFSNISSHCKGTFDRVQDLGEQMGTEIESLREDLQPLEDSLCQPLSKLREDISSTDLREYEPTGETPKRVEYHYPTVLPRTAARDVLIAGVHEAPLQTPSRLTASPRKATPAQPIFSDVEAPEEAKSPSRPASSDSATNPLSQSLREVDANLTTSGLILEPSASTMSVLPPADDNTVPLAKKSTSRIPSKQVKKVHLDGVENMPPSEFSQSARRRKSARLH